tara:strand:- start:285 stop:476 length:192 start_codon:yes stop_codon:yes gene_type:complete
MGRKVKYTEAHINRVKYFVNKERMTQQEAICAAGFSDSSVFYLTLKRLGLMKELNFVPVVSSI